MTDEQTKRIKDWLQWQMRSGVLFPEDTAAAFSLIKDLLKEHEGQKEWMARFANDSEAYQQGRRDERKRVVGLIGSKVESYRGYAYHTENDNRYREYTAIVDKLERLVQELEEDP